MDQQRGAVIAANVPRPRTGMSAMRRREAIVGYLWIAPWLIGFLVFTIGPMIASLVLSFTVYTVGGTPRFTGLDNYVRAFTSDRLFWTALERTSLFAGMNVPIGIGLSLVLAILLNQRLRGTTVYRTLVFIPSLVPIVAAALLWAWILHPEIGVANYLLREVGHDGYRWMRDPNWALQSLVLVVLWLTVGGSRMIVFLAGLQGVPQELHEAAQIDGANVLQRFRHVTIPAISPVLLFNLVLGIIASFSAFALAYVGTAGGPAYATWFFVLHIVQTGFHFLEMGYASALSWIFFLILIVFTYIQLTLSRRWVYYAGEVDDKR
jgi:multiple sugar transport system permease protein